MDVAPIDVGRRAWMGVMGRQRLVQTVGWRGWAVDAQREAQATETTGSRETDFAAPRVPGRLSSRPGKLAEPW